MPWKPATGGNSQKPRAASKSIRGQISGPIPMPDPFDEEFPMRDQAAMVARIADEASSDSHLILQEPSSSNQSQKKSHIRAVSAGNIDPLIIRQQQPGNLSSARLRAPTMRKSSASQNDRFTRISDQEDGRDSKASRASKASKPQRKKSTLRSALGKLFGRKKKTETYEKAGLSDSKSSETSTLLSNKQHRSDPTWERSNQMSIEPKRSFSTPITEYDRALRSHSIGPEDVMAITSVRNSINADLRMFDKNFTPFEPPTHLESRRWAGGSKLAGLSPRPASSQDRGTRMAGLDDDPSEIGRAISSEAHGLKRRSRSLSVMPSLELASQGVVRRRSAEIRYWRESYAAPFMSPTSTTADEEILQLLTGNVEELNPTTEQRAATPEQTILMEAVETKKTQTPTPTKMIEPAGAAERLSLDGRVSSLETRMSRLESIVLQLGQSIPALRQPSTMQMRSSGGPRQAQLQTPDHIIHSMRIQPSDFSLADEPRQSTSRPSTRHSDASKMTFGDISDSTPRATVLSQADGEARSSLLPPRGLDATSRSRHGSLTLEHYTNLMSLFETERCAREALETQVRSLGRHIQVMSKSMVYTNADQSDSPSVDRSFGEVSVFDHDDEDDERRHLKATRSGYNSLGMEDSATRAEEGSDEDYTESFVTPVETGKSSFDMYGNENDSTLSNGRKLSLSHLTMRQPLTTMQQVATKAS